MLTGTEKVKLTLATTDVGSPRNVLPVVSDVTVNTDRQCLVEITLSRFGRIDVLVNNPGVFSPQPFFDVTEEQLDRFIAVNLKGAFFLTQKVIPHMVQLGGGAIINIGTVLVDHAIAGVPASAAGIAFNLIQVTDGKSTVTADR